MLYQFPQPMLQNYWQQTMVQPQPQRSAMGGMTGASISPSGGGHARAVSPAMPMQNAFAPPGAMFGAGRRRKKQMGGPQINPGPVGGF